MKTNSLSIACTVAIAALLAAPLAATAVATTDSRDDAASDVTDRDDRYQQRHLTNRVLLRLLASPSLAGSEIDVSSEGTTVTLSGFVASEAHRERARMLALRTYGVREVDDRLEIEPQAVEARTDEVEDEVLSKRVAETLVDRVFPSAQARQTWLFGWEVDGYNWEIDIDVDDGIASIDGEVPTLADLESVVETTHGIPGVRAVRADLAIQRGIVGESFDAPNVSSRPWFPFEGDPGRYSPYRPD